MREGIFFHTVAAGVAVEVGVLLSEGVGGLDDHSLLAIRIGNVVEHVGKVLKSAVPCRIIR